MGGLSIWHLLILLLVAVLVFGTKKLRNVGSDLGSAVKSFREAMKGEGEEEAPSQDVPRVEDKSGRVIDAEVTSKKVTSKKKQKA